MAKFITIGERISVTAPSIRKAFAERDPEPILLRCEQQLKAGANYIDVNIGPAESDGEEVMQWAVKLLQERFDNVPLALDTSNMKAIEAGIQVYNRSKGKPIVNSADAGDRFNRIELAANNDAIVIALCSANGIASDNDERMMHCQRMLEEGLMHGMEAEDLWFDPLFLVVKGMQDKQMRPVQQLQRHAQAHSPDLRQLHAGDGDDAGPDQRDREPQRPAPDGDRQDLRHHQEQQPVRRFLSGDLTKGRAHAHRICTNTYRRQPRDL